MKSFHIFDETAPLKCVSLCRASYVPEFSSFKDEPSQAQKFEMQKWNKEKLILELEYFYEILQKYNVDLHFVKPSKKHPWQMYTRDTAFVIYDTLYFSQTRERSDRVGEIDILLKSISAFRSSKIVEISGGKIEGGDVIVDTDCIYVGISNRSSKQAIEQLAGYVPIYPIQLGGRIMHLDTCFTILPKKNALIFRDAFKKNDLENLSRRFNLIEVSGLEARRMATNVLVINPEVIIMHKDFKRLAGIVEAKGIKVESVDFSEPNSLLGSFRCATLPLQRLS